MYHTWFILNMSEKSWELLFNPPASLGHGSFAETGHHVQQPLLCLAVGAETLGPDEQMELVAGFSHL